MEHEVEVAIEVGRRYRYRNRDRFQNEIEIEIGVSVQSRNRDRVQTEIEIEVRPRNRNRDRTLLPKLTSKSTSIRGVNFEIDSKSLSRTSGYSKVSGYIGGSQTLFFIAPSHSEEM